MPSSLCPLPNSELLLNTIVSGLLSEGRMPAGSVLDAGAHMGRWACYYATAARNRKVWALEPVATNVEHMSSYYVPSLPNLRPMHGALGSEAKTIDSGLRPAGIRTQIGGVHRMRGVDHRQRRRRADPTRNVFDVYRLDDLFNASGPMGGTKLGFAHLDLEARDLPLLDIRDRSLLCRMQPLTTCASHRRARSSRRCAAACRCCASTGEI